MTEPKNLTLVEHNYYHLRANLNGADGAPVDYLFTVSQLEVARTRAADKPQLLPPPPVAAEPPAVEEAHANRSWFSRLFSKGEQ